jgi:hypothetical protein
MQDRIEARAEFDKHIRQITNDRKIDIVAEEAGDDTKVWTNLKRNDELAGEFAEAFGGAGSKTVDNPVPTIAKTIADEWGVRHEDVDVDVPANENDPKSHFKPLGILKSPHATTACGAPSRSSDLNGQGRPPLKGGEGDPTQNLVSGVTENGSGSKGLNVV